ncbi:hypothetical protein BH09SUM1_BH09SUM1_07900 [soil metagenome]
MRDTGFWKFVIIVNAAVPLAFLGWDAAHHQLGANPVSFALHTTGVLALIFLLLSLFVTPLRRLFGWNILLSFRRALGLFGFGYACLHFGIYFVFDRGMKVGDTVHEIVTRIYLQIGAAAIILMIPLAVTSFDSMVRLLGKRWKQLHRLAYPIAGLGVLHYYLQAKADKRIPLVFAAVLAVLLIARYVWRFTDSRKSAKAPSRKFWNGELKIAKVTDETPDVRTFRFVPPDGGPIPFDHLPGQYMNIQVEIDGKRVKRSYTIASSPAQNDYRELSIKREDMGVSSSHFHRNVRAGDRIRISAPAGKFTFDGKEADSVVLIAGGVGVTPMMSIIRAMTDRKWKGDIYFLFSVRTEKDIIFKEELERLTREHANLHVFIALSRADAGDGWTGHRGRVSEGWLRECVPDIAKRRVYICGPDAMMESTRELLLKMGVSESKILIEAFVSPGVRIADAMSGLSADAASDSEATGGTAQFARSGKDAELTAEMTVLEGAESAGVEIPYECRAGICGQCKVKLTSGSVVMDAEDALSAAEKADGWILSCQAHACGDLVVEV